MLIKIPIFLDCNISNAEHVANNHASNFFGYRGSQNKLALCSSYGNGNIQYAKVAKGLSILVSTQEFFHPVHFVTESPGKNNLIILFDLSTSGTSFCAKNNDKVIASGEIANKVLSFNSSLILTLKPATNILNRRLWLIIDKSWLIEKARYVSQQSLQQIQNILRFDNLFCKNDLTLNEIKAAKKILDFSFEMESCPAAHFAINAYTNELISFYLKERLHIEKSFPFNIKVSELTKIIEIRKYIKDNILQKTQMCLKSLCHQFHITESTFQRNFRKYFNCNFMNFYNEERLKKAYELLQQNDTFSVNEIAHSLGYKNVSYFSKRFKSMFNVYPKEVRKSA